MESVHIFFILYMYTFPFFRSPDQELMNEEVGHVLRTKDCQDNEGGIVAGFATMDTPFLVYS